MSKGDTPFRVLAGASIDELRAEIREKDKKIAKLEKKRAFRQSIKYLVSDHWGKALVVVVVAFAAVGIYSLISWDAGRTAEKKANNTVIEKKVFAQANEWITDHNGGKGDAWCSIDTAINNAKNRRLDSNTMIDCKIKHEIGDDILIKCAAKNCYLTKVRCTAVSE